MKKTISNEIKLLFFIACLGAIAATVFWGFRFIVLQGTHFLWKVLPEMTGNVFWYPIAACGIGGLTIGLFRRKQGDYPQSMMVVFGTVKKTGSYPYKKLPIILMAAVLPLIFGASVGPEAGMVGVITALCYWVGDNIKFAEQEKKEYSRLGAAVTLSVLFHSPLFGLFEMEEGEEVVKGDIPKNKKRCLYAVSVAAALGMTTLLNHTLGKVSEGFPTFEAALPETKDYLLLVPYLIFGILLGLVFEYSETLCEHLAKKVPPVAREVIAGLILGITISLVPMVKFSGEEQMGILMTDFAKYAPIALIGFAILKLLLTNICIQLGLKGGHFFPLIFSAVCLGYGLSLMIFPGASSHAVFAAAIVTAATLGCTMKKPIAVTLLLFLCFPIRMCFWLFFAAAVASYVMGWRPKRKQKGEKTND